VESLKCPVVGVSFDKIMPQEHGKFEIKMKQIKHRYAGVIPGF
jgi:hypothetical protein